MLVEAIVNITNKNESYIIEMIYDNNNNNSIHNNNNNDIIIHRKGGSCDLNDCPQLYFYSLSISIIQ